MVTTVFPVAAVAPAAGKAFKIGRKVLAKSGGHFDPYRKWPEQLHQDAG
jgi:hypothetical protein